eukprot:GHVN01070099.1.p1 GENE.GHVN01070099.1~~GHVN01070099.1.p1  ORF type:complete len:286 (+),score=11.39 GHVN01070099.1:104-961(+)
MGNNEEIALHYDHITNISRKENRRETPCIALRSFHNWIKAVLFQKAVRPGDYVIELGCGRGGDLPKYQKLQPKHVYFLDISQEAIQECQRRYLLHHRNSYRADFILCDIFSEDFRRLSFPPVDCISCQFSFHYAFSSEENVLQALREVSRRLVKRGLFFGVVSDGGAILDATENGIIEKISEYCRISFLEPYSSEKDFGVSYSVYLEGLVKGCPEYLVKKKVFLRAFDRTGFEVLEYTNLWDFYQQNISKDRVLYDKIMHGSVPSLNERAVSGLYSVFCVSKIKD